MRTVAKAISFILIFIFISSSVPFSANAINQSDNFYDVNFDDGTFNNTASSLSLSVEAGQSEIDYPYDEKKGSRVYRHTLLNNSSYVLREYGFKPSDLDTDKKVIWYETAIKFEKNVFDLDMRANSAIFDINRDGTLYFGSLYDSQDSYGQAVLAPVTILPDTWYYIRVAVDFADPSVLGGTSYPKFYAWVNGEFLKLSDYNCSFIWSTASAASKTSASRLDFYISGANAGDAFCMDDFKIYTTQTPVIYDRNSNNFRPDTIYSMDYESYSSFEEAGLRISDTDTESGVVISDTNKHFYRYTGGKTKEDFRYADLMLYNENAGNFYPDAVFQADYRIGNSNTENLHISFRDINARSETPIYIAPDGFIYLKNTNTKVSDSINLKNNWVNIALAFHYKPDSAPTYDIYINGTKTHQNLVFSSSSATYDIYFVRHHFENLPANGNFLDIDNIWVYKASEYYNPEFLEGVGGELLSEKNVWQYEIDKSDISPHMSAFLKAPETPLINKTERLTDYSEAKREYKDALCFAGGTENLWIKDGKYCTGYKTLFENGSFLVAAPVLAHLTDKSISQSEKTVQIGDVNATDGNSYITVSGKKIVTEVPVKTVGETIYIPLKEFAIYAMKKWYGISSLGFACIANEERNIHFKNDAKRPNLYTVSNSSQMLAYLLLDLPNRDSVYSVFCEKKPQKRPYSLGSDEEFFALRQIVLSDPAAKQYSLSVISNADAICAKTYTPSDTEGEQASPVFGSTEPWTLYWAYLMTKDTKYVEKAEELALLMCSLSHWSSSFHILQTSQGLIGASAFYDLFYNEFSESTLNTLANSMINKGLIPANEYYEGSTVGIQHDWCTRCTNWNIVPNSGIVIAASTLLGENYDDELMLKSLERAFVSLGYAMPYFAPDGGAGEGIGYTNFTLSYLCPMIDTLTRVFGTDFGLSSYPGFEKAGDFIPKALSGNLHFGLNDDSTQGSTSPEMSLWFAKKYNRPELSDFVISYYEKYSQNKEAYSASILQNYMPSDVSYNASSSLDSIFDGAGLAFSKDSSGETFLGVHAGHNHISHGRYDYGTFRFDAFGKRFASSAGCDSYSLPGIGNFAYNSKYYVIRAEGHNVYVVNPDEKAGQNRYTDSKIQIKEQTDKGVIYTLDMLPAYSSYVKSAQRGYMLTNDRKVLVIQDEITPFFGNQDEFYWFWHTYADVSVDTESNTAILTIDGKKVKLYFDANVEISLSSGKAEPLSTSPDPEGQLTNEEITTLNKITARFKGNGSPILFRVIAEPVGQTYPRSALTPISEWTVPDGSTEDSFCKKAYSIKADGEEIARFSPDKYDYTLYYSAEDGAPPEISAVSDGKITITQAQKSGDTAVVKIENGDFPESFKIYTVTLISRDDALGKVTTYADCDFTNHPDLTYEKSTENFFIYHSKGGSPSFETDALRGNRVLRYNIKSAEKSGAEYDKTALVHTDMNLNVADTTAPGAIVYEFSFKTDKFAKLSSLIFNTYAFETDRDGNMYVLKGDSKLHIGKYKANEWMNIKIIFENVYKYWDKHPRMYVFVNDNSFSHITDSFSSDTYDATQLLAMPSLSTKKIRFSLFANEKEDVNFYIDDVKLYTAENQAYGVADVESDLSGTKVTSDKFRVLENSLTKRKTICIDDSVTIAELKSGILTESQNIAFYKNGSVVLPEEYNSVLAENSTLYVRSKTNRLIMPYDIVSSNKIYADITLTKNELQNKCNLSELSSGDRVYIEAKINSISENLNENELILALYDGNKLIDFTVAPFSVGKNKTVLKSTQKPLTVPDSFSSLSIKAFIWENAQKARPVYTITTFN